jgi:hypothetical protein
MVRKSNEIQTAADGAADTEKAQSTQPKNEQRNRPNHQNQNTKGQYQGRQQNGARNADTQNAPNKDTQAQNKDGNRQGQYQPGQRNNNHGQRNHEGRNRENAPRGYYRDRNREADKDAQPRQHGGTSYGRHQNVQKSRAEETIEDIKQDIIRLEKEIELEIKEIRSLKFL